MPREYNRFNWIACAWITIGLFDLVIGYIIYAVEVYATKGRSDGLVIVNICGAGGLLVGLGWLTVCIQLNNHYWIRLNWIGILAIIWGSIHAVFAVSVFLNGQRAVGGMPPIAVVFNFMLSAISLFLILTGIYVLRRTDLYLQFRERD